MSSHTRGQDGGEEAGNILARLTEEAKSRYVSAYTFALMYLALGDKERAIDELEQAYSERSGWISYIKVDPMLDALRGHPRFEALVQKVFAPKLPQANCHDAHRPQCDRLRYSAIAPAKLALQLPYLTQDLVGVIKSGIHFQCVLKAGRTHNCSSEHIVRSTSNETIRPDS